MNKSPKEILNDIKQLYYQHQFPEALQLCKRLVARFPNNQDLKGLLLKIESRAQKENFQKSGDWQSSGSNNLEATQYYTERAEHEMNQHEKSPSSLSELYDEPDASASDQAFQVEQLIQKGVQLYEVQDYAQALQAWRQALTLDPTNQLAQDYVRNVSNLMNESSPAPRSQTSAPPPSAQPPDKQQLLAYYNEGLQLYKERKFHQALDKWQFILQFHPGHKETQECIKKTQAALEKEREYEEQLTEAERDFRNGDVHEAERKVLHLLIKAPHLEGAERLKEAIEDRKRQITEIRSLEIEQEQSHIASATEEEITRFFTPAQEQNRTETKPSTKVIVAAKKKKPLNWKLLIGIPVILGILAAGGFYFYKFQQNKLRLNDLDDPISVLLAQEDEWNSPEALTDSIMGYANDFSSEGDSLYAMLAYQRVTDLASPRLLEINRQLERGQDKTLLEKQEKLRQAKETADRELAKLSNKVVSKPIPPEDVKTAFTNADKGYYEKALETLTNAFADQPGNNDIRQKLAYCLEKMALRKIKSGELDEALAFYIRACVVNTWDNSLYAHIQVIDRFFNGKLRQEEKDEWFFFFLD
ncbi:MAG: hypothetical protein H6510_13820 [Acidobacteria bacterium]|nr:hypothetical protein [Acidobacteriota bacterium]